MPGDPMPQPSIPSDQPLAAAVAERFPYALEIALSGGGLRATGYTLGALLYLVHSGLNSQVKNIVSVSGGSITNAFVAAHCDFKSAEIEPFRIVAGSLLRRIARRGLWQNWWIRLYALTFAILISCCITAAFATFGLLTLPFAWTRANYLPFLTFGSTTLLLLLLGYLRSWPIAKWLQSVLLKESTRPSTISELTCRSVDHVFCATDLKFGLPYFFSTAEGGRQFSPIIGRASAANVSLTMATRASAAFPPLIPPVLYRPNQTWVHLDAGGWSYRLNTLPRHVWLSDGGIFNNFGTEWHQLREDLWLYECAYHTELKRAEMLDPFVARPDQTAHMTRYGEVQLAVDASQIAQGGHYYSLAIPAIGFIVNVVRTLNVLYGSTLSGRSKNADRDAWTRMQAFPSKWLRNSPEIMCNRLKSFSRKYESNLNAVNSYYDGALRLYVPYSRPLADIAFFFSHFDPLAEHAGERADCAFKRDEALQSYPKDVKPRCEKVRTSFTKLRDRRALMLLIAGYLNTREVLFCAFHHPPLSVPPADWFETLLDDEPPKAARANEKAVSNARPLDHIEVGHKRLKPRSPVPL